MKQYNLKNDDLDIVLISFGAAIKSIEYKGKSMVITPDDDEVFKNNYTSQGAVIGPTAGRIKNATFNLDGKKFELPKNFLGKHNLHGTNMQAINYQGQQIDNKVVFTSSYYDEYFQTILDITITYELIECALNMKIEVIPSSDTIINMTNHTYFNLGFETNILEHELKIPASDVWYLDSESLPREKIAIDDSVLDFSKQTKIGDKLVKHEQFDKVIFIDHPFTLKGNTISLFNPQNNIKLDVVTNQKHVVVYSGNYLDSCGFTINGQIPNKFDAICIETQAMPNAINIDEHKCSVITRANDKYLNETSYVFNEVK